MWKPTQWYNNGHIVLWESVQYSLVSPLFYGTGKEKNNEWGQHGCYGYRICIYVDQNTQVLQVQSGLPGFIPLHHHNSVWLFVFFFASILFTLRPLSGHRAAVSWCFHCMPGRFSMMRNVVKGNAMKSARVLIPAYVEHYNHKAHRQRSGATAYKQDVQYFTSHSHACYCCRRRLRGRSFGGRPSSNSRIGNNTEWCRHNDTICAIQRRWWWYWMSHSVKSLLYCEYYMCMRGVCTELWASSCTPHCIAQNK